MRALATAREKNPKVVVPIDRLDRTALHALAVARAISDDVTAVHVTGDDRVEELRIRERWRRRDDGIALEVVEATEGGPITSLLSYLEELERREPSEPTTVVVPEFIPRRRWQYLLHNRTALMLRLRLLRRPNTVVVSAPYRAGS